MTALARVPTMTEELAPRVHGVVRLRRDASSAIGVAPCWEAAVADVLAPDDLPDHRIELHVFPDSSGARSFTDGVNHAGGNVMRAVAARHVALVAVFVSDRVPEAVDLDAAIALFDRSHGRIGDLREQAVRDEEDAARRAGDRVRGEALDALWAPVRASLAGYVSSSGFSNLPAALEHHGLTEHVASVSAAFDPDHRDHGGRPQDTTARLRRLPGGRIAVSTGYVLPVTREALRHRLEAMASTCRAAGFAFDEASLQPVAEVEPGEPLRAALGALARVWMILRELAKEASGVAEAEGLLAEGEIGRILQALLEGGTISQYSQGSPGRLERSNGTGRGLSAAFIRRIEVLGFVRETTSKAYPGGTRYDMRFGLAPLGEVYLGGDAEALALAIRKAEAARSAGS